MTPQRNKAVSTVLLGMVAGWILICLGNLFLDHFFRPPLTPDSWSYYELSQSVWRDFYHVATIRQFQVDSDYGLSFPPLYPILISLWNRGLDIGVAAGYCLNFFLAAGTLAVLISLGIRMTGSWVPGALLMMGLLLDPAYVEEIIAARSIPLSIFLGTLWVWVFFREKPSAGVRVVMCGMLAGLGALTRFDFTLVALLLGWPVMRSLPWPRWKSGGLYYGTLFLCVSPWIVYSLSHFGVLWASDNMRTALLAIQSHAGDYFPPEALPPTVWTRPEAWLILLGTKTGAFAAQALQALKRQAVVVLALIFGLYGVYALARGKAPVPDARTRSLLMMGLVFLASLIPVWLSGYGDLRYFTMPCFFLCMAGVFFGWRVHQDLHPRLLQAMAGIVSAVFLFLLLQHFPAPHLVLNKDMFKHFMPLPTEALESVVREAPGRILMDTVYGPNTAFQFGAWTGLPTVMMPLNMTPEHLAPLVKTYRIRYLYTQNPRWTEALIQSGRVKLSETGCPDLYRLSDDSSGPVEETTRKRGSESARPPG